jgi:uncharacterized membrane protein YvlD (DUF360 family)
MYDSLTYLFTHYLLPLTILATVCLHILFAASIFVDARGMEDDGKQVYFVGPAIWATIALFLGAWGMFIYWVMHHSAMRRNIDPS